MPRQPAQRDPIGAHQRAVTAERRTGIGAQCECGEARPDTLIREGDLVICAACQRKRSGKTEIDQHHVAGEANDPTTIPVPVNDHRADLSVAQQDWPKKTLENPHGSPLLANVARIRGYIDTNRYLGEKLLLPDAEGQEELDSVLTERFGPKWWESQEFQELIRSYNR